MDKYIGAYVDMDAAGDELRRAAIDGFVKYKLLGGELRLSSLPLRSNSIAGSPFGVVAGSSIGAVAVRKAGAKGRRRIVFSDVSLVLCLEADGAAGAPSGAAAAPRSDASVQRTLWTREAAARAAIAAQLAAMAARGDTRAAGCAARVVPPSAPLLSPLESSTLLLAPKDGALRGRPARGLPLPPLMLSCRAMLLTPRVGVGAASACAALRMRGSPLPDIARPLALALPLSMIDDEYAR